MIRVFLAWILLAFGLGTLSLSTLETRILGLGTLGSGYPDSEIFGWVILNSGTLDFGTPDSVDFGTLDSATLSWGTLDCTYLNFSALREIQTCSLSGT